METKYYDGTKLLSMKDLTNRQPEIFMCTTNRTGGKTTYFNRLAFRRALKGQKFVLLYRFNYELDGCAEAFFKDIKGLWFSNYFMSSKRMAHGKYCELYYSTTDIDDEDSDKKCCGYAMCLNDADAIKKRSHLFNDVDFIIFDEFQSETNHYCSDELNKFQSIHTSIARGQGEQVRYVPVYMISNQVSIINPYYTEFDISTRLNVNTNFLRGDGWVLESGFIESASKAQKESGFNRAFKHSEYVAYSSENVYLNDNLAFVEKPQSNNGKYMCTIKYKGKEYAIREYRENGFLYCDDKADTTFPLKISVTTDDHSINYVMLKSNDLFLSSLRYYFEKGCFRFKDLRCKEALMKCISY